MTEQEVLALFNETLRGFNGMDRLEKERPLLAHYTSISVLESIMRSEKRSGSAASQAGT